MSYEVLANKLTERLFRDMDQPEYYGVIRYGMELMISTIGNLVLTILIAVLLHIETEMFVYCLFFIPYRLLSGGAHASTHMRCFLTFTICSLGSIFVSRLLVNDRVLIAVLILCYVFSFWVGCLYSTSTKKMDEKKKKRHKKISIGILIADGFLIGMGVVIAADIHPYMLIASMAIMIQSIALLPITRRKGEDENE